MRLADFAAAKKKFMNFAHEEKKVNTHVLIFPLKIYIKCIYHKKEAYIHTHTHNKKKIVLKNSA